MPITDSDTRSALLSIGPLPLILPTTGSFDDGDRMQLMGMYRVADDVLPLTGGGGGTAMAAGRAARMARLRRQRRY